MPFLDLDLIFKVIIILPQELMQLFNKGGPMKISFLGGAGTVTGSKFLLTDGEDQILIDCGMFQGLKQLRLMNWERLNLDAKKTQSCHFNTCSS